MDGRDWGVEWIPSRDVDLEGEVEEGVGVGQRPQGHDVDVGAEIGGEGSGGYAPTRLDEKVGVAQLEGLCRVMQSLQGCHTQVNDS